MITIKEHADVKFDDLSRSQEKNVLNIVNEVKWSRKTAAFIQCMYARCKIGWD